MSLPPKVSVVVPNYNHGRFLRRRIDSILAQTLQDFELILLDDCSTDESKLILSQYASDPRVTIELNETNSGTPFTQWNKGVGLARAEYVWIAESDDYAEPTFLEKLCATLDGNPDAAFAYCRSWRISVAGEVEGFADPWLSDEEQHRWAGDHSAHATECYKDFLRCNIVLNASAVLFRKGFYRQVGGADETLNLCGDWKLWAAMALSGNVFYVAEPLNYFRFHLDSIRSLAQRNGKEVRETRLVQWWILDQVTRPESPINDAHLRRTLMKACMAQAYLNYPMFPDISRHALHRAKDLGGTTPLFSSWRGELLKRMIGWKATRRAQLFYHRCTARDGAMSRAQAEP